MKRKISIRKSRETEFATILAIINDAAWAYRDIIPVDRWHEPYMPKDDLSEEIADGVVFWVAEEEGHLSGVMGMQDKGDVALIRHAYVVPGMQRKGVGTGLLHHVISQTTKPILVGTWGAATWAVTFYQRNGFTLLPDADNNTLLRRYWSIPERQIETSMVLADARWMEKHPHPVD